VGEGGRGKREGEGMGNGEWEGNGENQGRTRKVKREEERDRSLITNKKTPITSSCKEKRGFRSILQASEQARGPVFTLHNPHVQLKLTITRSQPKLDTSELPNLENRMNQ
jgi:hypothetical protein